MVEYIEYIFTKSVHRNEVLWGRMWSWGVVLALAANDDHDWGLHRRLLGHHDHGDRWFNEVWDGDELSHTGTGSPITTWGLSRVGLGWWMNGNVEGVDLQILLHSALLEESLRLDHPHCGGQRPEEINCVPGPSFQMSFCSNGKTA